MNTLIQRFIARAMVMINSIAEESFHIDLDDLYVNINIFEAPICKIELEANSDVCYILAEKALNYIRNRMIANHIDINTYYISIEIKNKI